MLTVKNLLGSVARLLPLAPLKRCCCHVASVGIGGCRSELVNEGAWVQDTHHLVEVVGGSHVLMVSTDAELGDFKRRHLLCCEAAHLLRVVVSGLDRVRTAASVGSMVAPTAIIYIG